MKILKQTVNVVTLLTFFFLGIAAGCSHFLSTDEEFERFRTDFETLIERPGATRLYPIVFKSQGISKTGGQIIGTCWLTHIEIDPEWYFGASELEKENVIFHELGHCICGLDHIETKHSDGCPANIMNATSLDPMCMKKHRINYLATLKKDCKG